MGGRGTIHKKLIHVMTSERITLLQCPDPVVLTSKASWNDAEASLGCSFPTKHDVFAAVSCEQWGEGRGKIVTQSHIAENGNISQNEQNHVELNFPKFLSCQLKHQL